MLLRPALSRLLAVLLLAASIALIDAGRSVTHEVRLWGSEEEAELMGFRTFQVFDVTEVQLLFDSTFSGVFREEGFLCSTYDRSQPLAGKQACPT